MGGDQGVQLLQQGIAALQVLLRLGIIEGVDQLSKFSLVVIGGIIEEWLCERFGFSGLLLTVFAAFRWVVIVLALLLGFAVIYYYGPNVEQEFRFITPGSVLGVVLLIAASLGFSFSASNFGDYDAT